MMPSANVSQLYSRILFFASILPRRTSALNASANDARLFPAASHALGMLDLPLRFPQIPVQRSLVRIPFQSHDEREIQ